MAMAISCVRDDGGSDRLGAVELVRIVKVLHFILKAEPREFAGGLDTGCERRSVFKDGCKALA